MICYNVVTNFTTTITNKEPVFVLKSTFGNMDTLTLKIWTREVFGDADLKFFGTYSFLEVSSELGSEMYAYFDLSTLDWDETRYISS